MTLFSEGYNSKFNKEVKESHPSAGILLCHVRDEIVMAEERVTKMIACVKKPAQRTTYRNLAVQRLALKKNYIRDRAAEDPDAITNFLSNIGYNVASAMMAGRVDEYEEARGKTSLEADDNNDVSTWVPNNLETSELEELECDDIYSDREIGVLLQNLCSYSRY